MHDAYVCRDKRGYKRSDICFCLRLSETLCVFLFLADMGIDIANAYDETFAVFFVDHCGFELNIGRFAVNDKTVGKRINTVAFNL